MFSDKGGVRDKIILVENDELISNNAEVAETFNNFFSTTVETLGIKENTLLLNRVVESDIGVDRCIKMYGAHPSIIAIRENVEVISEFVFLPVTAEDMEKILAALDPKKNGGNVPSKYLKQVRYILFKPMASI